MRFVLFFISYLELENITDLNQLCCQLCLCFIVINIFMEKVTFLKHSFSLKIQKILMIQDVLYFKVLTFILDVNKKQTIMLGRLKESKQQKSWMKTTRVTKLQSKNKLGNIQTERKIEKNREKLPAAQ
jgi:hypothetical protein